MSWDGRIWSGVFASFFDAGAEHDVFDDVPWVAKQIARARADRDAARDERRAISPLARSTDYVLPALAAATARPSAELSVLDFGGGLASTYQSLRAMLPASQRVRFVVVENERIVAEGRRMFGDNVELVFTTELPQMPVDIVHAGSSFHYVDDWCGVLRGFGALKPRFLVFADLPAADNQTFVTAQHYYGRRIPVRFWNVHEFVRAVEAEGFQLALRSRFDSAYIQALAHFEPPYRLEYFSQLVFRREN